MSVTSVAIGATGQFLDGFAVNANVPDAIRESVVITDPNDPLAAVQITSTQPISSYGVPVWMQGTPGFSVAGALPNVSSFPLGTTQVFGQVSSFAVNQLTTTSVNVLTMPGLGGTTMVNVVSTVATAVNVTTQVTISASTQIISSVPFYVSQSSAPWTFNGGVNVSTFAAVVSTWPLNTTFANVMSSVPLWVSQSSAPWSIIGGINVSSQSAVSSSWPLSTTQVNIVSSIPLTVLQGTTPWQVSVANGTPGQGLNCSTWVLIANLNTTVVKNGPATLYGWHISNFASTSVYIKLANASSNVIASTAKFQCRFGASPSTSVFGSLTDLGVMFSTGIAMFTTRNAWNNDLTAPLGSTCVVNLFYK